MMKKANKRGQKFDLGVTPFHPSVSSNPPFLSNPQAFLPTHFPLFHELKPIIYRSQTTVPKFDGVWFDDPGTDERWYFLQERRHMFAVLRRCGVEGALGEGTAERGEGKCI